MKAIKVDSACNGLEGFQKAVSFMPDIILLDIMMPERNGLELCQDLRHDERFNNTLIAFLTARNEDYNQILGLEQGGDDYITKPIRPKVLISRVKALLRRSKNLQDSEVDQAALFGDLEN